MNLVDFERIKMIQFDSFMLSYLTRRTSFSVHIVWSYANGSLVTGLSNAHQLNHELGDGNQGSRQKKSKPIFETIQDTATEVRKWLPW